MATPLIGSLSVQRGGEHHEQRDGRDAAAAGRPGGAAPHARLHAAGGRHDLPSRALSARARAWPLTSYMSSPQAWREYVWAQSQLT